MTTVKRRYKKYDGTSQDDYDAYQDALRAKSQKKTTLDENLVIADEPEISVNYYNKQKAVGNKDGAVNPVVGESPAFQDLEIYDINYDLMTREDPNVFYVDILWFNQ